MAPPKLRLVSNDEKLQSPVSPQPAERKFAFSYPFLSPLDAMPMPLRILGSEQERQAAAQAQIVLGPRNPLTQAPYGDGKNVRTAAFAAHISKVVESYPEQGEQEPPLILKQMSVVHALLSPVLFEVVAGQQFDAVNSGGPFPLFEDTAFTFGNSPQLVRGIDGLPTPELLLNQRPIELGALRLRPIQNPAELTILAISLLRHVGANAYFAGIVAEGKPFANNIIPAVAVLDSKENPHIVTCSFNPTGGHPPVSVLEIYSDEAVMSFLHALDAMNRLNKFAYAYGSTAKKWPFVGVKSSMPNEAIVKGIEYVCEAMDYALSIWRSSFPALQMVGQVGKFIDNAVPKAVKAHFTSKLEEYRQLVLEHIQVATGKPAE